LSAIAHHEITTISLYVFFNFIQVDEKRTAHTNERMFFQQFLYQFQRAGTRSING
jgi:hypothetical protein